MLDTKRLRVLREVARAGSFSGAADALSYTQSAISQQIAALEREAGTVLIERGGRGIRLTDAGRALVEHAERILAGLAAAEAELEAIADLRGGRLRLASFPTAGATLLPLAVAEFSSRHPGIELSLVEAEPEQSVPQVRAGEVDLALVVDYVGLPRARYQPSLQGISCEELIEDPMYIALPPGHPLAGQDEVRLDQLADEAWIQGDFTGMCGAMHRHACLAAGFDPRVSFESDDYSVVQGLVAAGVGVALLPMLALANRREDIEIRSLGPSAPLRRVLTAVREGYRSPATAAMLAILGESAAAYVHRDTLKIPA